MPGQRTGSLIAAVFGLMYVLVNTGSLSTPWMVALRILAAAAFLAVLVTLLRSGRPAPRSSTPDSRVFGRGYWLVVAVEVVALFVGVRVISGPLDLPQAAVAWVTVVVGVHFIALGFVFRQRFFHRLGAVLTTLGLTGFVLAATGAGAEPIAVVSGVLPGAVLLGFGWWGAHRTEPSQEVSPGSGNPIDRNA